VRLFCAFITTSVIFHSIRITVNDWWRVLFYCYKCVLLLLVQLCPNITLPRTEMDVIIGSKNFAYHANTLWGKRTVFTHLAITPLKVNRFRWNLEQCEPNVGGWPWQILGVMCTLATVWKAAEIGFFLFTRITHDFTDFRRTYFATFEHNNVSRSRHVNFWNRILP